MTLYKDLCIDPHVCMHLCIHIYIYTYYMYIYILHIHIIYIYIHIIYTYVYIYILYIYMLYIYIYTCTYMYSHRQNYGEKKNVSIYRRRLSMIEKLRTFFFSIIIVSILVFSIILSVTVCPSIQKFECILRGNIELYRKYVSKDLVYAPKSSIDIHNHHVMFAIWMHFKGEYWIIENMAGRSWRAGWRGQPQLGDAVPVLTIPRGCIPT